MRSTTTSSVAAAGQARHVHVVERDRAPVEQQAAESLAPQRVECRRDGVARRGRGAVRVPFASRSRCRSHSHAGGPSPPLPHRTGPNPRPCPRPRLPWPTRCRSARRRPTTRPASRSRRAGACPRATRRAAWPRLRPSRESRRGRTSGTPSARCAHTAAAGSRGSRSSCRPSSAGCGCCSSAGWRWPGRCPRSHRRRASPCARGTGGRTPTATRHTGAAPRRRSCRRPATTCPTR